jgi:hypothetical protein
MGTLCLLVPIGNWGHAKAKFIGYAGEETYLHH